MQLDVRFWDLQGAVAGGAAAELETWSLLPAVCPTRWKQLSVLGHCRSETQAVFVLLGYSWCLSGRKKCPPIHTPDSYPIHTPIHTLLLPFAAKRLLRSGQYQRSYAAQILRTHKTQREALKEPARGSFRISSPEGGFGRLTAMYQARHGSLCAAAV